MTDTDTHVRWTLFYAGNVQGVGFRFTTVHVARRLPVTGYVRNLPDGRVEVVAEGAPDDLRTFQEALEESMAGYIRDQQRSQSPGTGEFSDFSIRH